MHAEIAELILQFVSLEGRTETSRQYTDYNFLRCWTTTTQKTSRQKTLMWVSFRVWSSLQFNHKATTTTSVLRGERCRLSKQRKLLLIGWTRQRRHGIHATNCVICFNILSKKFAYTVRGGGIDYISFTYALYSNKSVLNMAKLLLCVFCIACSRYYSFFIFSSFALLSVKYI
jgi:hypothetical protein